MLTLELSDALAKHDAIVCISSLTGLCKSIATRTHWQPAWTPEMISRGILLGDQDPAENGPNASVIFFDRNPQPFSVVLDFLRTGTILLPPSVSQDQADTELEYFGVPSQRTRLKNMARNSITALYCTQIKAVEAAIRTALETAARQGRMAVMMTYVARVICVE